MGLPDAMLRNLRTALLVLLPIIGGCYTVQIPLDDQGALDRVGLVLPDTRFPSKGMEATLVPILESKGFRWNDPRYSLGHHMIRKNELVMVMPDGTLEVRQYIARFRDSGFRVTHYVPTQTGDLGKKGTFVTPSLLQCLYNRSATAFTNHKRVSFATLLVDGVVTGGIDTILVPFTAPLCETVDRRPLSYSSLEVTRDASLSRLLNEAWGKTRPAPERADQNGKPRPTNETTPASVE